MGPPTLQSTNKTAGERGPNKKGHLVFFRDPNFNTIISGHIFVMKMFKLSNFWAKYAISMKNYDILKMSEILQEIRPGH